MRAREGEGQRDRRRGERERVPNRLLAISAEPDTELGPTNCEILT